MVSTFFVLCYRFFFFTLNGVLPLRLSPLLELRHFFFIVKKLGMIGTYQILFEVSVTETGQLILTLNGQDLDYTVAGRATGSSQIVGMAVVTTTAVNSILTVRNPASNAAALTITPLAGGTRPVSAHLVITQIA